MGFGRKVRPSSGGSTGDGSGLAFVPKEGVIVRFLTEPPEWLEYRELFSQSKQRSWPVPESGGQTVGDEDKPKAIYAACVLRVDDDEVVAMKIKKTLGDALIARFNRVGTITDKDLYLFRTGEGFGTTYGYEPADEQPNRQLKKYKALDLEQALTEAYEAVWPDETVSDDDELVETPKATVPKRRGTATPKPGAKRRPARDLVEELDPDDDDDLPLDDDWTDEELGRVAADDDVEEDDDDTEDSGDWYTYDELNEMDDKALRALCREYEIKVGPRSSHETLVQKLL